MPISDQNPSTPRVTALALALSLALGTAAVDAQAATGKQVPSYRPHAAHQLLQHNGKHPKKKFDLARFAGAARQFAQTLPQQRTPDRQPATRRVTNMADAGAGSLRDALASAIDGDVIDLRDMHGRITLTSPLTPGARVTIQGPGRELLTLDGGGKDRVLASAHSLVLSNITIANGATPAGSGTPAGGCLFVAGSLSLSNATFDNCHAIAPDYAFGGAIAVNGGSADLFNSTITNSTAEAPKGAYGGALFVAGAPSAYGVTLSYSTISGNGVNAGYSAYGGGVFAAYSNAANKVAPVSILASTISGNTATATSVAPVYVAPYTYYYGFGVAAAVWTVGSNLTLTASTVTGNTTTCNAAADGGAIYTQTGSYYDPVAMAYISLGGDAGIYGSVVSNNTLTSNYARAYGGGVEAHGNATITGSTLSGNLVQSKCPAQCYAQGGALFTGKYSLSATITGSTLSGNTATGTGTALFTGGGAISTKYRNNYTSITLTNSTISGNIASAPNSTSAVNSVAGGIYQAATGYLGTITSNNSTIAFNSAGSLGGGVVIGYQGTLTFTSSIVGSNIATAQPDTADFAGLDATTVAGNNNLVQVDPSGGGVTLTGMNNIVGQDPLLQPLASNGGHTQTHALGAGSPAIDTGINPLVLTTDQRGPGFPREVPTGSPDMGAFELDSDRIFFDGFE